MQVLISKNQAEASEKAAQLITDLVIRKPHAKLGLATGSSAEGVYPLLLQAQKEGKVNFSKVRTVNLDEYVGLAQDSPASYRMYMDKLFFNEAGIPKENIYVPNGLSPVEDEIANFKKYLAVGYTDLQLLGVGVNGHIGFNEAGPSLDAEPHIENLDQSTIDANARFFDSPDQVPQQAFTMGMADIMKAEKIVLIACGESKIAAIKELLTHSQVSTQCPVSFLKLHRDVTVIIDDVIASALGLS